MLSQLLPSLASLLIGGFAGHFLALGRDTRKRRNAVREPIWTLIDESWRRSNKAQLPKLPSADMVSNYRAHVSVSESRQLEDAITRLETLKKRCVMKGVGKYLIPPGAAEEVENTVQKLLHITRVR